MLSQEQLQAIVRATGRLPPGYENAWRPLQWQPQEAVSAALPRARSVGAHQSSLSQPRQSLRLDLRQNLFNQWYASGRCLLHVDLWKQR